MSATQQVLRDLPGCGTPETLAGSRKQGK